MFHELKKAWDDVLYNSVFEADHYSQTIKIPMKYFERLHQEFNICFVEEDEDPEFRSWQEGWDGN